MSVQLCIVSIAGDINAAVKNNVPIIMLLILIVKQ